MVFKTWPGPLSQPSVPPQKVFLSTNISLNIEQGYRNTGVAASLTVGDHNKKVFVSKPWEQAVEEIKEQAMEELEKLSNEFFQKIQGG